MKSLIPSKVEAVDITSTDHTSSGPTLGIYVGGAGTVQLKYRRNAAAVAFPAGAYQVIEGDIEKVVRTGTTATSMVLFLRGSY